MSRRFIKNYFPYLLCEQGQARPISTTYVVSGQHRGPAAVRALIDAGAVYQAGDAWHARPEIGGVAVVVATSSIRSN